MKSEELCTNYQQQLQCGARSVLYLLYRPPTADRDRRRKNSNLNTLKTNVNTVIDKGKARKGKEGRRKGIFNLVKPSNSYILLFFNSVYSTLFNADVRCYDKNRR